MGRAWFGVAILAWLTLSAAPALAAPTEYTVGEPATAAVTDDVLIVSVKIQNLTDGPLPVAAQAPEGQPAACAPRPDPKDIPARSASTVAFHMNGCTALKDTAFKLPVTAGSSQTPLLVDVPVPTAAAATPRWVDLRWLFAGPGLAAVALGLGWSLAAGARRPGDVLRLPDGWSFKEAWATNVTVLATLVTGVFGASDVLKAIFGDKTTPTLAVLTVSSAITVGVAAAAPLVLSAVQGKDPATGKSGPRVIGLVLSAFLTISAAAGALAVIVAAVAPAGPGRLQSWIWILGALAYLALGSYAFLTVRHNLTVGVALPEPDTTATLTKAQVAAVRRTLHAQPAAQAIIDETYPDPPEHYRATSPGDDRPRSVLM